MAKFADVTPYIFCSNNPLNFTDVFGLEDTKGGKAPKNPKVGDTHTDNNGNTMVYGENGWGTKEVIIKSSTSTSRGIFFER